MAPAAGSRIEAPASASVIRPWRSRLGPALAWCLALGLLCTGCAGPADPTEAFVSYREDVALALGADPTGLPADPPRPAAYPSRAARQAAVVQLNVDLRSFWGFGACDLRALIAGRNTALARAESGYQRLPYEHAMLNALRRCREPAGDDVSPTFAAVLEDVYAKKLAARDANFWNATFGSREFVHLYSPTALPLPLAAGDVYVPTREVESLGEAGRRFGRPGTDLDREALARAYQALERSEYGGRLARSLAQAGFFLGEVNRLLGAEGDFKRLCPMRAPTRRARELNGAFRRHYVRVLQPYLAGLARGARPWLEAMTALGDQQRQVMPDGFVTFFEGSIDVADPWGAWQQYLSVSREHARLWGVFLDRCGIPLR